MRLDAIQYSRVVLQVSQVSPCVRKKDHMAWVGTAAVLAVVNLRLLSIFYSSVKSCKNFGVGGLSGGALSLVLVNWEVTPWAWQFC